MSAPEFYFHFFQSTSALETGIFQVRIRTLTCYINVVLLICTLAVATILSDS